MTFAVVERMTGTRANGLKGKSINIRGSGRTRLSNDLLQEFGDAEYVLIGFDEEKKLVGIKPVGSEDPNAVKLYPRKTGKVVELGKLFKKYNFRIIGKFKVEKDKDGWFCFDASDSIEHLDQPVYLQGHLSRAAREMEEE